MPISPPPSLRKKSPWDFLSQLAVVGPELEGPGLIQEALGKAGSSGGSANTRLGQLAAAEKNVLENLGSLALSKVDDETRPFIEHMLKLAGDVRKATMMTPSHVKMGHPETIKTVEDALRLAATKQEKPSMLNYLRRVNNHLMDVLHQLQQSTTNLQSDLTKSYEQRLFDKVRSEDLTPEQAWRLMQEHKGPPVAAGKAAEAEVPKVVEQGAGPGSVIRRRAGEEKMVKETPKPAAPKAPKAASAAPKKAPVPNPEDLVIDEDEAEAYLKEMMKK